MMKSLVARRNFKLSRRRKATTEDLMVKVFWGDVLYDTAVCVPGESVTIGTAPSDTFIMDLPREMMASSVKIVEVQPGKRARVRFNDSLDGHLKIGSELLSFRAAMKSKHAQKDATGFYEASLGPADRADFLIGHVSFYLEWVAKHEFIPSSRLFSKRGQLWVLGTALALLGLIALLTFIEPEPPEKPPERLVTLLSKRAAKAALGEKKTADGGAQTGEAGKAELKPVEKPSAASTLRNANLGSLVSGLTSIGNNAPSVDSAKAGVNAPIAQAGTGGFTTQGLKTGAGGNTVGIGRTVGRGEGGFEGTGRLGLSGNSAVEGGTGHGDPGTTTGGGLDRDVIESVIRRRLDRIRLCYERQLNFNPKLTGKISVNFVIGKKGEVLLARAMEDTMKNTSVRECVLSEVKSWTFPAPEGGTLVNVDYPFVFESSAKGN